MSNPFFKDFKFEIISYSLSFLLFFVLWCTYEINLAYAIAMIVNVIIFIYSIIKIYNNKDV